MADAEISEPVVALLVERPRRGTAGGRTSAARALNNGAQNIERADKLVQLLAKQKGLSHPMIDGIVSLVDRRLAANRGRASISAA